MTELNPKPEDLSKHVYQLEVGGLWETIKDGRFERQAKSMLERFCTARGLDSHELLKQGLRFPIPDSSRDLRGTPADLKASAVPDSDAGGADEGAHQGSWSNRPGPPTAAALGSRDETQTPDAVGTPKGLPESGRLQGRTPRQPPASGRLRPSWFQAAYSPQAGQAITLCAVRMRSSLPPRQLERRFGLRQNVLNQAHPLRTVFDVNVHRHPRKTVIPAGD